MKNMKQYFFLSIIITLFNLVYSKKCFVKRNPPKNDNYYLIFVNNTYSDSQNVQKRQEPEQFVNSIVKEIHELIINNEDTFKNPDELKAIEQKSHPLKKRNDNFDSNLVYEIASLNDISVLLSYLSYELNEKVKLIPGIRGSSLNKKLNLKIPYDVLDDNPTNKNNKFKRNDDTENNDNIYNIDYDTDDNVLIENIKLETGWKDVEIKKDADPHLSLLSQGKFNTYSVERYDTNYYYPKSAGEGIDVYILDTDFNFEQPEFSNKDERKTKCLGVFRNGNLEPTDNCAMPNDPHGELIADAVGGIKHGAARKANIYGLVLELDGDEGLSVTSATFIKVLEYIRKNLNMKPYKSVLSISLGQYFLVEEDAEVINFMKENFDELNKNGIVVVVSSGNERSSIRMEYENKEYIHLPCAFDSVICVGGIDNYGYYSNPRLSRRVAMETKYVDPDNYIRARFSNYGDEVDIFAPGLVYLEYQSSDLDNYESIYLGTSFASPLVAGVAATIMSEHSEIQFNSTSMAAYLTELGLKDVIEDAQGPNVFINNGKQSLYLLPEINYDEYFTYNGDYDNYDEYYTYEGVTVYNDEEVTDSNGNDNEEFEIVTEYITVYDNEEVTDNNEYENEVTDNNENDNEVTDNIENDNEVTDNIENDNEEIENIDEYNTDYIIDNAVESDDESDNDEEEN